MGSTGERPGHGRTDRHNAEQRTQYNGQLLSSNVQTGAQIATTFMNTKVLIVDSDRVTCWITFPAQPHTY